MMRHDDDVMMTRLADLRALQPSGVRADRVREQCHALIARRHQRAERRDRMRASLKLALEPTLVAGFGVSFLLAIAFDLAKLHLVR